MPAVCLGGAADVQVDELVEQRLQHVAGADAGVGGDGEAELGRHGEAEAVGAAACSPHLELGLASGQKTVGEHRQGPQPGHLLAKGDPGHEKVGRIASQPGPASGEPPWATPPDTATAGPRRSPKPAA